MRTAQQIAASINATHEGVFATSEEVQSCIDSISSAAANGNPLAAMFAGEEPTLVEVLAARTAAKEKKMTNYTTDEIREYIETHEDGDTHDQEVLADMFTSVYHREPNEDEQGVLWSHVCNLVDHA